MRYAISVKGAITCGVLAVRRVFGGSTKAVIRHFSGLYLGGWKQAEYEFDLPFLYCARSGESIERLTDYCRRIELAQHGTDRLYGFLHRPLHPNPATAHPRNS